MFKSRFVLYIGICLLMTHCQSVTAPKGSVPKRNDITTNAFGSWISVSFLDSTRQSVEGEFIALQRDTVYIMIGDKIDVCKTTDIRFARIIVFRTEAAPYGVWTALASLATLSNGGFLIFTLPITLMTGIFTTVGESKRVNFFEYPTYDWKFLSKHTRFPQGIPQGVNLHDLKSQPMPK